MTGPARKGRPYRDGELEVILGMVPTEQNIRSLATLLERSEEAIEIVYRLAYGHGPFGKTAEVQRRKIEEAKQRLGIRIGRAGRG